MPRFFFDLADHERSVDQRGTELKDADTAKAEAVVFAGSYLRDHPSLVWDGKEVRVIVRGEDNAIIFTVVVLGIEGS